jgi:hypothetical protein
MFKSNTPPIHNAVLAGRVEEVKRLLNEGNSVNAKDSTYVL